MLDPLGFGRVYLKLQLDVLVATVNSLLDEKLEALGMDDLGAQFLYQFTADFYVNILTVKIFFRLQLGNKIIEITTKGDN